MRKVVVELTDQLPRENMAGTHRNGDRTQEDFLWCVFELLR
jgi:hypothetical protein